MQQTNARTCATKIKLIYWGFLNLSSSLLFFFFLATAKVNTVFKPKKYKTLSCHSTNDCNNYSTTVWHNEENENFYNKTELKILLWQFLVWFVNMYPYYGKACNIIIYIISKPASSSSTAATAAAVWLQRMMVATMTMTCHVS